MDHEECVQQGFGGLQDQGGGGPETAFPQKDFGPGQGQGEAYMAQGDAPIGPDGGPQGKGEGGPQAATPCEQKPATDAEAGQAPPNPGPSGFMDMNAGQMGT